MKNDYSSWLNERGQIILLTAGVAGLLFIMIMLQNLINPLGDALIIGIILYPIRRQPVARALMYATVFTAGLWLMYDSGHLLIPFVVAYILAFLINPLVMRLEHRGIPRWFIATFFTIVALSLIGLGMFFGLPVIANQFVKMGRLFVEATNDTNHLLSQSGFFAFMNKLGLGSAGLQQQIAGRIHSFMIGISDNITNFSTGLLDGVGSVVTILFFIILLPFLLFFMIRDYDKIGRFVRSFIVPEGIDDDYTHEISRIVGSYIRGQFIVVVISAINLSIGFTIFKVPYAVILGIFAGLTNFIPTFGLWLSITVCTIVGATTGTPWYQFLPGIYLVFAIEQILETGWIVPRVVGKHVGLHPLLVMISLMIFGFMFGFLGLIIAVPTVALLSTFYEQYRKTHKISFLGGSELDTFFEYFESASAKENKAEEN
jgi:predicted PurR-regulated permease PerM